MTWSGSKQIAVLGRYSRTGGLDPGAAFGAGLGEDGAR
jgi:hypothetical protein